MKLVNSMTGFGLRTMHIGEVNLTIEIKTLNSRYLDFTAKLPHSIQALEGQIKGIIQTFFERGRIEVTVTMQGTGLTSKKVRVDWELLDDYIDKLRQAKVRYNLEGEIPISIVPTMETAFSVEEIAPIIANLNKDLLEEITKVARIVVDNRKEEGIFLLKDVTNRINSLQSMLKLIEDCQGNVSAHYRERIKRRIEAHVGAEIKLDQTHLIGEIAILAEKGDISEEITRLHSHLSHIEAVISGGGAMGRKLDFITQEMHREVNTIGAKSIDPQISEMVVIMKSDIEKIKEQVQNIE